MDTILAYLTQNYSQNDGHKKWREVDSDRVQLPRVTKHRQSKKKK